MLRGYLHDLFRIFQVVQIVEQFLELPCRRHPEQGPGRLVGLVEVAMRYTPGHAHEIAGLGLDPDTVQLQVQNTFLDKDEFILRRMHMYGNELTRLRIGFEGKRAVAAGLRIVNLTENIPGLVGVSGPLSVMPFSRSCVMVSSLLTVSLGILSLKYEDDQSDVYPKSAKTGRKDAR